MLGGRVDAAEAKLWVASIAKSVEEAREEHLRMLQVIPCNG